MCFSATASFAAGVVLIPTGIYLIRLARRYKPRHLLLAVYPLVFGIQQILEGLLWLNLENNNDLFYLPAFGFIFFSILFWPFWVPFSVWWFEPRGIKRQISLVLAIVGGICGAFAYFPLLLNDGWLQVFLVKHSIVYEIKIIYDGLLHRDVVNIIYASIVLIPLLIQSDRYVRYLGILIFISVVSSRLFFDYAFISIWCYFAAVLSLYIIFIIQRPAESG